MNVTLTFNIKNIFYMQRRGALWALSNTPEVRGEHKIHAINSPSKKHKTMTNSLCVCVYDYSVYLYVC